MNNSGDLISLLDIPREKIANIKTRLDAQSGHYRSIEIQDFYSRFLLKTP